MVFVALKEEQNQVKSQTQMVVDIVFDSINDKNSYEKLSYSFIAWKGNMESKHVMLNIRTQKKTLIL